jgi:hypothetical protein
MSTDERLAEVIACLKSEDQDLLFEELSKVVNEFGWELSRRDPGPVDYVEEFVNGAGGGEPTFCELDEGWCHTHNAWIDDHEWELAPDDPLRFKVFNPPTAEIFPFSSPAELSAITDSYRRLAEVRRKP